MYISKSFKRLLLLAMAMVFIFAAMPPVAYAEQPIRVRWEDWGPGMPTRLSYEYISFPYGQPMMIDNRVFLPLRGLPLVGEFNEIIWYPGNPDFGAAAFVVGYCKAIGQQIFNMIRPGEARVTLNGFSRDTPTSELRRDPPLLFFRAEYRVEEYAPAAAQIVNNRMMVPIRMMEHMQLFCCTTDITIDWESASRTVVIRTTSP